MFELAEAVESSVAQVLYDKAQYAATREGTTLADEPRADLCGL